MKKDKAWLKEEVYKLIEGYTSFGGHEHTFITGANVNKLGVLIDQLDEPETLNEEWIENHTASADTISYYSEDSVPVVTVEKLKNLLVPNQDKPVLPQFVADWIDAYNLYGNNPLREYIDLESDFNEGWTDEEDAAVYHWVNENPYAFIDALRYGCEVEKESHYYVAFEGEFNLLYVTHVDIYGENGKFNYSSVFDKKHALKFTDKSKAEYLADLIGAIVV